MINETQYDVYALHVFTLAISLAYIRTYRAICQCKRGISQAYGRI